MLLDTSSLMYRAFFALPTSIEGRDGRPVNAVHGYLDMTSRLLAGRRPHTLVHVMDDAFRPEERVRAYPAYKVNRPPDPEGLSDQFTLLEEVLDAFGVERAVALGWEADDAIGALCAHADRHDTVDVVTGDRDLLQLVRDGEPAVRVLFTVRGVSELAHFDVAAVLAKHGVPPSRYADFAMLRGDPSDGLPGVQGVGEQTARRLIAEYSAMDALLQDAAVHPPSLARRLSAARAYLDAMQRVVPVRSDVAVTIRTGSRDANRLREIAARAGLGGPIRRLTAALDDASKPGGADSTSADQ